MADNPNPVSASSMQDAIQAIWQRSLPETRTRIALLQRAEEQLRNNRTLDPALHAEALSVAHKLAGSLGMFGFGAATDHARAIEEQLSASKTPESAPFTSRVGALVASLPAPE